LVFRTFEKLVSMPISGRTSKPRTSSLTIIIDKGIRISAAKRLN
jgi:hypothetical protein